MSFCSDTHLAGQAECMYSRGFPLLLHRTQLSYILLIGSRSRHTCSCPRLTNRSKRPLETDYMSSLTIHNLSAVTTRIEHYVPISECPIYRCKGNVVVLRNIAYIVNTLPHVIGFVTCSVTYDKNPESNERRRSLK